MTGIELGGGKLREIGGIGEVLGFEAKAGMALVEATVFAAEGAVEIIGGVELNAWLGGIDLHAASGFGFGDDGYGVVLRIAFGIEDEGMVEALGLFDLSVGRIESVVKKVGFAKVEWGIPDGFELAGGGIGFGVVGEEVGGEELELVLADIATILAGEIEVGMGGKVDEGGGVGGGGVFVAQAAAAGEGEGDGESKIARVAHFAVGAVVGEAEGGFVVAVKDLGIHELVRETAWAAVEVVTEGFLINGQLKFFSFEGTGTAFNAAGEAADEDAHVVVVAGEVIVNTVEAEDDIVGHADAVGNFQFDQGTAPIEKGGAQTALIGQGKRFDGVAILGLPDSFYMNFIIHFA